MASMSAYFFAIAPKSRSPTLLPRTSFKPYPFTPLYLVTFPKHAKFRSISLIRATSSADVVDPSSIRPGGAVESDKLPSDVRNRTMKAIDSSGRRVTLGDVASKAGLKLNEAQKALQALAADTGGFLEVSDEGDVLYVFSKDYRSKLAAKSFRVRIEPYLEMGKMTAEYVIRASFGTALIASIVIVYTTIIAIAFSSREKRGKSFNPRYWDPFYYSERSAEDRKDGKRRAEDRKGGMNFIESIFSFVFGDGDPNQGIEEERWKLIGKYIASNGGVVAADELAPYLDVQNSDKDDGSYILPVLLRFDGQPELDDEGNILYRFPSLQRTASPERSVGRKWSVVVGQVQRFFKEKNWEFSKASVSERAMVIGLGGLNLFGVIVLNCMFKNMSSSPNGYITFVYEIFPLLQIYAGSFFAIPLIRWFFIQNKNAKINKRNQAREVRARALESPDLSLRRKLLSAWDMAQRTFISKDRIVYSTDKDLIDQDYDKQEWDRRFKELEKSE